MKILLCYRHIYQFELAILIMKKKTMRFVGYKNGFIRDTNEIPRLEIMTYSTASELETEAFNQHG